MNEQRLRTQIDDLLALRNELAALGHDHLVAKVDDLIAGANADLAELLSARPSR